MAAPKIVKRSDPLYGVKWSTAGGRCQAVSGAFGGGDGNRCPRNAEAVFVDSEGTMVVLCKTLQDGRDWTDSDREDEEDEGGEEAAAVITTGDVDEEAGK